MIEAVLFCLDRISSSIERRREFLFEVPLSGDTTNTVTFVSTEGQHEEASRSTGKRVALKKNGDEDVQQGEDSEDEEHGACLEPSLFGNRRMAKPDGYPCPLRKKDPLRYNIREWEYCAKAPFKTISDLK